jgi:hypothetical protein
MKFRIKKNENGYYIQCGFLIFWSNYTIEVSYFGLYDYEKIVYFATLEEAEKEIEDCKERLQKEKTKIIKYVS